ncbi:hypothetical protein Y696_09385 [Mesotoga sp. H07pep.5.4]|nr:hypothetical protein Y696_09385 [Mesotoga sp. H07pep.5.4]
MLPPAGSEARWREEVMPGRASGEVMLALTHQEAKSKEKEQGISCKFQVASSELRVEKPNKTGFGSREQKRLINSRFCCV